ncbi:MAG TPA: tol-pal system protein YbgF [Geobacteraceae bacterium]
MKMQNVGIPIALVLALAGCASKGDLNVVQSDLDEIKGRSFRTEKELVGLRADFTDEMNKKARESARELAKLDKQIAALQEGLKDIDTLRKTSADLQANLDTNKVDMRALTGKVDDLSLQVKKPADDLAVFRDDLERRLTAIEDRLKRLEEGKTTAEPKKEQTPDALYQQGLAAAKSGKPQKAREILTKFVEAYPAHELTPNARYWIGETYYSEKNYEQAILEFQQLIKDFPGKEKVPAAMLKQGMAFKELGDVKSARYVYKKLMDDFPSVPEAKTAKERLKEMK